MTDKKLLQQALDALEMSYELQDIGWIDFETYKFTCDADILKKLDITIKSIKARLAQPDCVCGEPDSEGVHRKDKPCYVEPEPEPVAWMNKDVLRIDHIIKAPIQVCRRKQDEHYNIPLYTTPQKKEWVGLTDEEIMDACSAVWASHPIEVGNVVQDLLKEKNT